MSETWAVALRGREGGSMPETQEEIAYALRTPEGGSSQQLIVGVDIQNAALTGELAGTLQADSPGVRSSGQAVMELIDELVPQGQRIYAEQAPSLGSGDNGWISSTGDSRARTSAWPAGGPVLGASAAVSGSSFTGCCENCGHDGRSLRMSPDFYPAAAEQTSPSSSPGWTNSGSMQRGRYWTRSTSESRSAAAACSLSQVLEAEVPSKFYLSARAAAGIIRRAALRGRTLPEPLGQVLRAVAEQPDEAASRTT